MALGDIESGDCHDIRTENGSETLLGRMRGLGGKLIPVVVLKRSRRTIFPFDFLGSLEIGLFFAAPKDKQSHTVSLAVAVPVAGREWENEYEWESIQSL
jgi:hypothetical protein